MATQGTQYRHFFYCAFWFPSPPVFLDSGGLTACNFFSFHATICVFWMCSLFTQNVMRMDSEDLLPLPSISYSFTESKLLFKHSNFNHAIVCPDIPDTSLSHLLRSA